MKIHVLKSKVHNATVTEGNLEYEGSLMIDETLMKSANLREFEKVLVANFTNGNRYETYVMKGKADSGTISVNGAGARYSCVGDKITIFAFAELEESETNTPLIVIVDDENRVKKILRGSQPEATARVT
jgi:aspartate 1-decarboxylase